MSIPESQVWAFIHTQSFKWPLFNASAKSRGRNPVLYASKAGSIRRLAWAKLGAAVLGVFLSGCNSHNQEPFIPGYAELSAEVSRMQPVLAPTGYGRDIGRAVLDHPLLSAEAARILRAEADMRDAEAASRPQVSLGANLGTVLVGSATPGRYLPVVQVSQLLFDGGRTRARIEAARIGVVSQELARETSVAQLTLTAVELWHELEYQKHLFDIAEQNYTEHRRVLAVLEERLAGGIGTQSDLQTVQSRVADARARQITARGNLERSEASFLAFFGELPNQLPRAQMAPPLPSLSDAELIATSPRIRGIDAEIGGALALLNAADASGFPTVTATIEGNYDLDAGRTNVEASTSPSTAIFTGGRRNAERDRARAYVAELRSERAELEREIRRSLAFLRSDMRTGQERVSAARDAVRANRGSATALSEQYSIGRVSILQLLDAQRDLFLAKEALALAERDYALSGYAALALTGDIIDVFGTRLRIAREDNSEPPILTVNITASDLEGISPVPRGSVEAQPVESVLSRPFVQVGVFRVARNASDAQEQMERAGFPALIRPVRINGTSFQRVLLGPAQNRPELERMLAHARQIGFLDAFFVEN